MNINTNGGGLQPLPPHPTPLSVQPQDIPNSLKLLPQWCVWRYGKPRKDGNRAKPPVTPSTGRLAKPNDPSTFEGFEQAMAAYSTGKFAGVGFALFEGDGLVGIDLDHCIHKGAPNHQAQKILDQFEGCYTEISPSGTGYRIFCKGSAIRSGKGHGSNSWVEVYDHTSPRYLTVTGERINTNDITPAPAALDWLHQTYMMPPSQPLPPPTASYPTQTTSHPIPTASYPITPPPVHP